MSQDRILRLLKRNYKQDKQKYFTSTEIMERLKLSNGSITQALKKLRNTDFIKAKRQRNHTNMLTFYYRFK